MKNKEAEQLFFIFHPLKFFVENHHIDSDNDAWLHKDVEILWLTEEMGEESVGFVGNSIMGKIVEVFYNENKNKYFYNEDLEDPKQTIMIDDWMGKFITKEKNPEEFV